MKVGTLLHRITIAAFCGVFFLCAHGCEKEKPHVLTPSESRPTGKREYGEIKPVVLELPQNALQLLGGTDAYGKPLKEAHIYFRGMTLVVYRSEFDVKDYIDRIAGSFAEIALRPEFIKEADTWAVQMQQRMSSKFVTVSCAPDQVVSYAKGRKIKRFLNNCDYLMINDVIISDPGERLKYYNGDLPAPSSQSAPEESP